MARAAVIIHATCALCLSDANDDSGWSYTQAAEAGEKSSSCSCWESVEQQAAVQIRLTLDGPGAGPAGEKGEAGGHVHFVFSSGPRIVSRELISSFSWID